jgi:hypothetical protein
MAERQVINLRNPVAIWAKLKEVYSTSGFSARFLAWKKLFSIHHDSQPSIEAYVDEIRSCCMQLKGAGFEVHPEIQASVLLNGLGSGYENFVTSISQYYRRKEDISVDELVSQLFDEQRRKSEIDDDHAVAFVSRINRPSG